MFSQPPEKEPSKSVAQKHKSTRKKRKKQKHKNKKESTQIKQSLANTMSAWAENFTMAATWQLKHQVAMWKSRASALEYENQILRETLRQFYVNGGTSANSARIDTLNTSWNKNNSNNQLMDYEQNYMDCEPSVSAGYKQNSDVESSDNQEEEDSELELEISDEYMAFLRQNFEYRKAREERKMKEAAEERMKENQEVMDPQPRNDRIDEFKELYGDAWQQLAALDTYLSAQFISLCDSEKPGLWPNIPLRF
ncbi:Gem-associated protein 8 [Operophtera brumata]|uniref:Gem-associated protein 8 n=1 Tax=Operophtera brumata TaxID=104452 RepID=A0A0L7LQE8_OPEBR|nr:Gem-associated protein 8 [Operophtera brumata]